MATNIRITSERIIHGIGDGHISLLAKDGDVTSGQMMEYMAALRGRTAWQHSL